MKQIRANIITWDPREDDTYLNGTSLSILPGKIKFKNDLMSPGKALVTWYSQRNFQAGRRLVKLPLLTPGQTYQVRIETDVEQTLYLKVSFYSRFDELLKTVFIKETQGEFEYPADAYEYRLALINAGAKEVNFKRLVIAHPELKLADGYCYQEGEILSAKCALVFTEPELRAVITTEAQADMVVFNAYEMETYFCEDLAEKVEYFVANAEEVAFVGNGPLSNAVAAYYSEKYHQRLVVRDELPPKEQLQVYPIEFEKLRAAFEKATVYQKDLKVDDLFAEKLYEKNVALADVRVR